MNPKISHLASLLCFRILHSGVSEFQDIELVESGPFGKVGFLLAELTTSIHGSFPSRGISFFL